MCLTQNFYLNVLTTIIIALNVNIFTNIPGSISTPAFMGLGLYYATSLEYGLPVLVVHFGHLLSYFPSIPHIINYGNLTHETEIEKYEENTPKSTAAISFFNTYLRYSESDEPILKGISFEINKGEKIGIVGRTGAGKSSLITALLRLMPNQREGYVLLHSRNICSIPLSLLRKSITIVPQEPVFFLGTLRTNLDPSGTIEDAKLWEALKSVDFDDQLMTLDIEVQEGGRNWSQGQKQLVSLARAYLRNSEVLVFDEATASLDNSTDANIQETIRHLFKECTMLVIAHRLNTVIDYDRVLVMDSGKIVEFDHPYILLSNEKSSFYSLVKSTGKDSVDNLTHLAKQAYIRKQMDKS